MLKDTLKQEIETLNDEQLQKVADFVTFLKFQNRQIAKTQYFWESATSMQRSQNFRQWVSQLPSKSPSLPDEAFKRDSIYE